MLAIPHLIVPSVSSRSGLIVLVPLLAVAWGCSSGVPEPEQSGDSEVDGATGTLGEPSDSLPHDELAMDGAASASASSLQPSIDPVCQTVECCPPEMTAVVGDEEANVLIGGSDGQCLVGLDGADRMIGGARGDVLLGGGGDDVLLGGSGNDVLSGGPGADELRGHSGDDEIYGGEGDDFVAAGSGNDVVHGGAGDDVIWGGSGNDLIYGGAGDDVIHGGAGDDVIRPGAGRDEVNGGRGDDTIIIISACEVVPGETIHGGSGTDRVWSPLTREELEALGVTFTSIEIFETIPEPAFGAGACYPNLAPARGVPEGELSKILCECCEPGWGGEHCRTCIDPERCGRADEGPFALPLRTRYFDGEVPEFTMGIFPGAASARPLIEIDEVDPEPFAELGWHFDTPRRAPIVVESVLPLGAYAEQPDGARVWTMAMHSPNATNMGAQLEGLILPPGAILWAYGERAVHGPVTAAEVNGLRRTVVPPIPGDTLVFEILEPPDDPISLDKIAADPLKFGPDEACFEDIACHPNLTNFANGVGLILHGGFPTCSGTLLNANTQDEALFLTAEHCMALNGPLYHDYLRDQPMAGEGEGQWMRPLSEIWLQFHYRHQLCDTPDSVLTDVVQTTLTYPVSDVVYHDHEVDIGVYRVGGQPDPVCVTYNGYDALPTLPTPGSTAGVGHPDGLTARLEVDGEPPLKVAFFDDDEEIEANFLFGDLKPFWERRLGGAGDVGWRYFIGSGSPLFNPSMRVIGQSSGYSGNPDLCQNAFTRWFCGRFDAAVDISNQLFPSSDEQIKRLSVKLGDTLQRDLASWTESEPFPLLGDSFSPCVGAAEWKVNPYVADHVRINWQIVNAAPGQIIGVGTGELAEFPNHVFYFGIETVVVNPGGSEPPITIRITTDFGPGHPGCFAIEREFLVQPIDCTAEEAGA